MDTDGFLKFALGGLSTFGLTVAGVAIKAWYDRVTYASNEIFQLRMAALNAVWQKFLPLKKPALAIISNGIEEYHRKHPHEDFLDTLDAFRLEVDNSQIVLDKDVIEAFRKIDTFFYLIYKGEDMKTSRYKSEIDRLLEKLEAAVASTLSKRHHRVSLKLRT